MKRTLADIRENMPHVGCDNETALEMCDEIERLRAAVDRDKTGLAAALNAVRDRLNGSAWLGETDAWGSYEYDERTEDNLRREFAECLADAERIAIDALRASGTLATKTATR